MLKNKLNYPTVRFDISFLTLLFLIFTCSYIFAFDFRSYFKSCNKLQ